MRIHRLTWWTVLVVGATIGLRVLLDTWNNFSGYLATTNDPSAKDAYLTFLELDLAGLTLVILVTGGVLWVVGRSKRV